MFKKYGKTNIVVCNDYEELGKIAATEIGTKIRALQAVVEEVKIIFAAAESQMSFLKALSVEKNIDWQRIICFNMDELHGENLPARFTCAGITDKLLYEKVKPKEIHLINANAVNPLLEAEKFERLLRKYMPINIVCMGIGISGHIALNEPGECQFDDNKLVRVVNLSAESERQLLTDPNFQELGYIPRQGITMTLPALMSAEYIYTIVPLPSKKDILRRLFSQDAATEKLPASILREYAGTMFIDKDSCPWSK